MTGSAIALPLLGATGASAADGMTWNQLANCESGGDWTAIPGNGHYGGLQLSSREWVAYGGLAYATSPEKASRAEQIAVAEKLLATEGPSAFGGCTDEAALLEGTGTPTGGTDGSSTSPSQSPAPSDSATPSDSPAPSDSAEPSDEPSDGSGGSDASPSDSASPSASDGTGGTSDTTDPSDDGSSQDAGNTGKEPGNAGNHPHGEGAEGDKSSPSGDASDGGSGRHRRPGADDGSADGRSGGPAGRHASRGGEDREDDGGEDGKGADGSYVVRPGDNLSVIADSHGVKGGWPALYAGNKKVVGTDPDLILPGQTLDLGLDDTTGDDAQKDASGR
ncbi:transglycosylase family protein [Streptomyces sp. NPDC050560]|uniref:transglycosylase family protein n=1 Tax=Streptomyces sp. NPDC050560 TaxID=3365630 RepID=UPI00379FF459